jgi:adenine phosphoribosyltransferase
MVAIAWKSISIPRHARVIIADDLIATGGTAAATAALVTRLGGTVVECAFIIELGFLNGRQKLQPYKVYSLLQFDSE